MLLRDRQAAFAAALDEPSQAVPEGVHGRFGRPDARRFAVYRNNVAASLAGVLEAGFPVVRRLVGCEFFRAMARAYVGACKPTTPLLMEYGATFPDFISAFRPADDVPFLADVARLERAWTEAYHAAEAAPLESATQPAGNLAEVVLALHPSLRLVRSPHPVGSIWTAHQDCAIPQPPEVWEPEDILVVRPHAEVLVHRLPAGGGAFVAALAAGSGLGDAAAAAAAEVPAFDLAGNLVGLFHAGAVVGLAVTPGTDDTEEMGRGS